MSRAMTRPWQEIVKHYSDLKVQSRSIRALGDLASRVANSRYRSGLFAWTSMSSLCITQIEVSHPYDGPHLRLSPITDDRVEFRFVDTRERNHQWHREVAAEDAYDRLEKFLRSVGRPLNLGVRPM